MTNTKATTSFWIISILALVWNLIGVMAFSMDMMITEEALSAMPEAERLLYESSPAWTTFIYGVAVFAGTLGSILLLIKNARAVTVFWVSFIAILIQMGYALVFTKAMEVYGLVALVMPITVTTIGAILIWFSSRSRTAGILI